jgi:hypothetical protein
MWIDQCAGAVAPVVTFQNTEIAPAITDQYLIGGKTIDGPGCWQFALWNKWAPYLVDYGKSYAASKLSV